MTSLADPSKPLGSDKGSPEEKLWKILEKGESGLTITLDIKSCSNEYRMKMLKKAMTAEIAEEERQERARIRGKKKKVKSVKQGCVATNGGDNTVSVSSSSTAQTASSASSLTFSSVRSITESGSTSITVPTDADDDSDSEYEDLVVEPRNYRNMCDIETPVDEEIKAASHRMPMLRFGAPLKVLDKTDEPDKTEDVKGKGKAKMEVKQPEAVMARGNYRPMTDIKSPPPENVKAASLAMEMPRRGKPIPQKVIVEEKKPDENKTNVKPRNYRDMCDIKTPVSEQVKAAGLLLSLGQPGVKPEEAQNTMPNPMPPWENGKTREKKAGASSQESSVPATTSGSATSGGTSIPASSLNTPANTPTASLSPEKKFSAYLDRLKSFRSKRSTVTTITPIA